MLTSEEQLDNSQVNYLVAVQVDALKRTTPQEG